MSKAVPTGSDEEANGALLQAGVEEAQSNADLAEHARGELPLSERALPLTDCEVAEIGDEHHERLPQTAVGCRPSWVQAGAAACEFRVPVPRLASACHGRSHGRRVRITDNTAYQNRVSGGERIH
jgi:hypothetical protein